MDNSGKSFCKWSGDFKADCISNGRTGELIEQSYHPEDTPIHRRSGRQRRSKLQAALLKEVDESKIKLSKKLVGIEKLSSGRVIIRFEDGFTDEVDLLIAADGIRSVSKAIRESISKS